MKYYLYVRKDENSERIAEYIRNKINGDYDALKPDIVIAVGGDGTILEAFHRYQDAVLFGVHTGHLGFFANYNPDTVDGLIHDINNDEYKTEDLSLLSCIIRKNDGTEIRGYALNEVTVISTLKTLILDIRIDDEYLEKFRGTGLCVSTTSGSTAYNKSLHGAVVDHDMTIMQLAEIASINSNAYRTLGSPLVLNQKRRITFTSDAPLELTVSIDHLSYSLTDFRSAELFYEGKIMKMAYHHPEGFIKRISRTFIDSGK